MQYFKIASKQDMKFAENLTFTYICDNKRHKKRPKANFIFYIYYLLFIYYIFLFIKKIRSR